MYSNSWSAPCVPGQIAPQLAPESQVQVIKLNTTMSSKSQWRSAQIGIPTLAERSQDSALLSGAFFLSLLTSCLPSCMPASFPPSFFLLARSVGGAMEVVHLYLFPPSTVGLEDARHGCLLSLPHQRTRGDTYSSRDEKQT